MKSGEPLEVYVLQDMRKGRDIRERVGTYSSWEAAQNAAELRFPNATLRFLEWRTYETLNCWTLNFCGHGLYTIHKLALEEG